MKKKEKINSKFNRWLIVIVKLEIDDLRQKKKKEKKKKEII